MSSFRSMRESRVALGIATLAVACAAGALVWNGTFERVTAPQTRTIRAVFQNVRDLRTDDPVRIDGVQVGKVDKLTLDSSGRTASVELAIEDRAWPIYADASARVVQRTLLGGNFVVSIDRGHPTAGDLGSKPITRTSGQDEIEDLTSIAGGGARKGLRTMPGEIAKALRNPHDLAGTLDALGDASPSLAGGLTAMQGVKPQSDLRTFVSASARTVRALDAPNDAVERTISGAAATLTTTARRQQQIRDAFVVAPSVMRHTQVTLSQLTTTLELADPLIARLRASSADVAPTVARLRPVVSNANRLARSAVPLLRTLRPAVSSLASAANTGHPLLKGLAPSLTRLADQILPFMGERDPDTDHTTAEMVGPGLTALGAILAPLDSEGHYTRFPLSVNESSLADLPCRAYLGNPHAQKLADCEDLFATLAKVLNYNPLTSRPSTTPRAAGGKSR